MTAFSFSAPAFAGGGHYARHGGHHAHGGVRIDARYHGPSRRHYRGHRRGHHRGRHHGHGRIDGGEAALIALGVIGGAILINEAVEADRREVDRAYDERRYRRYDPERDEYYYRRGYEAADYDDGYDDDQGGDGAGDSPESPEDYYEETPLPERPAARADDDSDDPLEEELLGREIDPKTTGRSGERPARDRRARMIETSFPVRAAYRDCADEARAAARRDGQIIAMPAEPTRVEKIGPDRVRITADLTAQRQRGGQHLRTLTCEADRYGVSFLELT